MKFWLENFVYPCWMELLGLCLLAISIAVNVQILVDVGFALLIAGTLISGFKQIRFKFDEWRCDHHSG